MATGMDRNQASHCWWLDSHSTTRRSPWLQSTIAELNEKTKAMLKLIEEDADSFAQRAEMYYKKRPELISMVEDFYRTYRSLAERYDQVKSESGTRHLTTMGSPFASFKYQSDKISCFSDRSYDSYSECFDPEESAESEVDDPEQEEEKVPFVTVNDEVMRLTKFVKCRKEEDVPSMVVNDEAIRLREEIEKLREENMAQKDQLKLKDVVNNEVMSLREEVIRLRKESNAQKDQLKQKDEEKIEVIKQLSLAIDLLKQENVKMRKRAANEINNKWKNPFEINKLLGALSGKLFNGTSIKELLVAL